MSLSTVMVCLRVGRPNAALLGVAGDMGRRFGARVVGVAARQIGAHAHVGGVGPFEPAGYEPHKFLEDAAAAEREFRAALAGVATLEWRRQATLGPAYQYVADEARCADLVIAPLEARERTLLPSGQAEIGDLIMRLGRPILIVPSEVEGFAFRQALVCFKDVREARRALADALPVLKAMTRVHVVEIAETGTKDEAQRRVADVGDWLALNGVAAASGVLAPKGGVAHQLAAFAREIDADLVVGGAFGHSRLREWAFGGVTRDLILHSGRCVLASH